MSARPPRVLRAEPHGNTTCWATATKGARMELAPTTFVSRSEGPSSSPTRPSGCPAARRPRRELAFSGVFRARDGEVALVTDELAGPNGIAFSPDERWLYVGNWTSGRRSSCATRSAPAAIPPAPARSSTT
jgi:gluconolactonase